MTGALAGPGLSIRRAALADVPELVEVESRCFPGDTWGPDSMAAEVGRPGSVLLVGELDGRVVGYALGWSIVGDLEVLRLAVAPSARRAGLGRALLDALHVASRAETAFLEVRADNEAALRLYQAAGYEPIGVRRRYYADRTDAVAMRCTLSRPERTRTSS